MSPLLETKDMIIFQYLYTHMVQTEISTKLLDEVNLNMHVTPLVL